MERQDFFDTRTELKAMISNLKLTISSLKLTIDTLNQTVSSQNATIVSLQESINRLQCAYDKVINERDDLNCRLNRSNQDANNSISLKQRGRGKTIKKDLQNV